MVSLFTPGFLQGRPFPKDLEVQGVCMSKGRRDEGSPSQGPLSCPMVGRKCVQTQVKGSAKSIRNTAHLWIIDTMQPAAGKGLDAPQVLQDLVPR